MSATTFDRKFGHELGVDFVNSENYDYGHI
jgi:hypothetical protein